MLTLYFVNSLVNINYIPITWRTDFTFICQIAPNIKVKYKTYGEYNYNTDNSIYHEFELFLI